MLQGLNESQRDRIKHAFIIPTIDSLLLNLNHLPQNEQLTCLQQLLQLIIAKKETYQERLDLSICEDVKQQDEILELGITHILQDKACDESSQKHIYQALYGLLHELRFNKSPDSKSIDLINTLAASTLV